MLPFLRRAFGVALFGAGILFAFAQSPIALAHDMPMTPPASAAVSGEEGAFLKENDAAMIKMMNGMAAKPRGDIDRDFVAMMIPHHQGAVDMAVIELRYGKNEQLRRIAQEIIVDQMQEIAAMKLAVGDKVPATAPAPTQPAGPPAENHQHDGMQMDMSNGMSK